jgi:hypothetical protein
LCAILNVSGTHRFARADTRRRCHVHTLCRHQACFLVSPSPVRTNERRSLGGRPVRIMDTLLCVILSDAPSTPPIRGASSSMCWLLSRPRPDLRILAPSHKKRKITGPSLTDRCHGGGGRRRDRPMIRSHHACGIASGLPRRAHGHRGTLCRPAQRRKAGPAGKILSCFFDDALWTVLAD